MDVVYPFISVIIVSFISVLSAIPLLLRKRIPTSVLLFLLSMSVGVLLSTVFMDFLPETMSHEHGMSVAFYILSGFMMMFILEKFVHFHHNKKCENGECGHGHAYNLAPINLIGDGIHNFIDGLVIAGSYAVSVTTGIAATISIIFHEIPQEIADFGVLLYSGMTKKKALIFNLISAATAILGVFVGIVLIESLHDFTEYIIPFAAGNFIYIAASNLVPQLHRQCKLKDTLLHILAIILGIGIIALVITYGPTHGHG
ncbi:MAG: ZIP family metal transporter [Candidatus Woesearchaeota archaeon]